MSMSKSYFYSLFCIGILIPFTLTAENRLISRVVEPSFVDRAAPFLKNADVKKMLGLDIDSRNKGLPLENKQYKCQILTSLYTYWRKNFNKGQIVVGTRLNNLLNDCHNSNFNVQNLLNQTAIFPGTNWCGQANVAQDYHDLGFFNETDSCCREHDFCEDIIQPGKSKHNLINPYSTTRLNCACDEALRQCFQKVNSVISNTMGYVFFSMLQTQCFQKVNSVISNTMGYVFFSMLQTQCFKLEYPASGCLLWRPGSVRLYCVHYALDETKPKKWQWFDQAPYF